MLVLVSMKNILNSQHAYNEFKQILKNDVEEFWVMGLTSDKKLIQLSRLFKGTVDYCICHPRDIFKFACESNSSQLIVAHNHPSNSKHPSVEDLKLTKQLLKCGRLMQIPIIDHLIITDDGYCSFADYGYIKF